MKTYQDLQAAGEDLRNRAEFIAAAIKEHEASREFQRAAICTKYYDCENPTINNLVKIIYDIQGAAHRDEFSANHHIASSFVNFAVDQEVSYLLGNGITWNHPETVKKLGADFDQVTQDILTAAENQGQSFGFWNHDHLEVFQLSGDEATPSFVPLYDAYDGQLKAGIRYWSLTDVATMATLFELDGLTKWKKDKGDAVFTPENDGVKERYVKTYRQTAADGKEYGPGENYEGFPIVPMRYNRKGMPMMHGKRNTVDALDLVTSKLVNNVDDGNLVYWLLKNCDGMDEVDDAEFLRQLLTTKIAHIRGDGEGASADPKSIEAPFAGTEASIGVLTRRCYDDFKCFDAAAVSAGNVTATAIRAAYTSLDLKADKTEAQLTKFLNAVLKIAGVDDTPSYTRNQQTNVPEMIQVVIQSADYTDDEYTTKKILTLLGDADQTEDVLKRRRAEEEERFAMMQAQQQPGGGSEE